MNSPAAPNDPNDPNDFNDPNNMENNELGMAHRDEVRRMFDDIAPTYDRLNHLLSLGIDRLWRRRVVRMVRRTGAKRILDLATGTGDLALAMARKIKGSIVCGVDLSSEMLAVAREKVERCGLDERITFEQGDAEHIGLADGSVDAATVAFGVRNFEHPEVCLAELARVVRSGGHLFVLEFSNPKVPVVKWVYRLYSHIVLPAVGGAISNNRTAYEYLPRSVDRFSTPAEFCAMLERAGFVKPRKRSLSFGIAYIYVAERP